MAETVKKSRIVSDNGNDDNLEEALMEEFNMRLKKCMSQDDLQTQIPSQESPPSQYDNVPPPPQEEQQQQYEEVSMIKNNFCQDFIRAEQENYYEEPKTNHNGYHHHHHHQEEEEETIYENVGHQKDKTEPPTTVINRTDQYIDMTILQSPTAPPIIDDDAHYEDIMELSPSPRCGLNDNRPNLTLTDLCQVIDEEDSSGGGGKAEPEVKSSSSSVKDRMLLSTDMAPCLLFTQTVTSPMLTPSDENIDFLKGFQQSADDDGGGGRVDLVVVEENSTAVTEAGDWSINTTTNNTEQAVYENSDFLHHHHHHHDDDEVFLNHSEEVIYENVQSVKENIYENLKTMTEETVEEEVEEEEEQEVIYQNVEELKEENERDVESTQVTESYVETTTVESHGLSEKGLKKKKSKKSRKEEKENISVNGTTSTNKIHEDTTFYNVNVKNLKSSFNKFDALQKKNILHVRSSDSSKAQEKFNGAQQQVDNFKCRSCDKTVFQMEQIKAEKAIWHKNCFRCNECNKQLNVDTYQSNEGTLYCKPHFKALFAPKVVEDDAPASDKPDLGLEELQTLNVKERFQVFEHHHQHQSESEDRTLSTVNVKRSPSILSKLAKFQAKGMDIGVADDSLNGIPIEESSSEEEEEEAEDGIEGEDADLIRAKRVQKEKPFHFTGMLDVKNRWEQGEQHTSRDERREERKQEIQSIRNRLFMGKQGKMKEAYQQAVMESESGTNVRKEQAIEVCDTKSLKERFEKGEVVQQHVGNKEKEGEEEVFESEISKKSRSLFLELDANASKAPQIVTPLSTPRVDVKKARETYLTKSASEDVVKSSTETVVDELPVRTADIQQRFKFFETYKEPEKEKRAFRITPPREGQVKASTPDKEVYRDPDIVRSEEFVEDSVVAKEAHTATKMLSKFRQMEENLAKEPQPSGPKPLKRFTPPPEPTKPESSSEAESGDSEEEDEDEEEDETDRVRYQDEDLIEAQKAARAKQLRAKFERWEANEIKREQNNSTINIIEEFGDEQSQIESTKSLRARFESMRDSNTDTNRTPKVKVNRFVEIPNVTETCESCHSKVYPLEKISVHNHIYHKKCFKCMECNCVLRMDSYSYNQGLLYCTPHFKRLFISKGNYDTGFGLDQRKEKWNVTTVA